MGRGVLRGGLPLLEVKCVDCETGGGSQRGVNHAYLRQFGGGFR